MNFLWVVILFVVVRPTYQVTYTCNSTAVCGCSKNSASVTKIIGGEDAGIATWGWAVSIQILGNICGGSIISKSWIITAAHCVIDNTASQVTVYASSNVPWSGMQIRTVSQIIIHSQYNRTTFINDIALLKLTSPLNMSDPAVSSICLPSVSSTILAAGEWPVPSTNVIAVGWGTLSFNGNFPDTLQQVTLKTLNYQDSTCIDSVSNWHTQICAGSPPNNTKDTCGGDSGGPLMMFSSNNQWLLVGLTSFGAGGCAVPLYSGVYTRVAAFETWIKTYTNDSNWVVISHANNISTSTSNVLIFIVFIFVITFHH